MIVSFKPILLAAFKLGILLSCRGIKSGRFVKGSVGECDLDCRNDGHCVRLSKQEMLNNDDEIYPPEKCICTEDYTGILCDMKSDCQQAEEVSAFSGRQCKHPETFYCDNGLEDAMNKNSFCTNGGNCREYKEPDELHTGCDCPEEFGGKYCEFFLAVLEIQSNPYEEEEPMPESSHSSPHVFLFISLFFSISFLFIAAVMLLRKRNESVIVNHQDDEDTYSAGDAEDGGAIHDEVADEVDPPLSEVQLKSAKDRKPNYSLVNIEFSQFS